MTGDQTQGIRATGGRGRSLTLVFVIALTGCQAARDVPPDPLVERAGAITGCAAKSVTTIATVAYDYDLAGRQTRDRDARLLYDPWNQLKEVQLITTTAPKYNDGRTVVAEKHTYGFDGIRTSTTTNPGAANAAVRVQITPDDLIHDGKREHYVRMGDRIVARLAMTATGTLALNDPTGGPSGGGRLPAGLHPSSPAPSPPPPWPVLGLAAVVFAAVTLLSWRRRRRWAPSWAGVALLAVSCQMFGENLTGGADSLLLAERVYFHTSLGAGPSLITRQDGTILEERRFEPFGAPIDAFRSGRSGTAPVDLVTDPQSIVGKQADATNAFTDHGARWLSSQSGRWLTPDPAARVPDVKFINAPWELHPYSYVKQNPTALWDPDGRCSAPVGLKPGEVGVCFEAFIATKWVPGRIPYTGRGDDRTFAADDDKATARFQIRLRINPVAKFPVVQEEIYDHVSGLFFKNHGPKGDVFVTSEVKKDPQGNVDLKYDVSATNGPKKFLGYYLRFLVPDELDDPIDMSLKLRTTLGGKLSITGGAIDGYPSWGIYGYRVQKDGSVKSFRMFESSETTIDKLKDPLDVEIPTTKAQ